MLRIPGFHCRGPGSIPGRGTETPQTAHRGQNKQKSDDFKMSPQFFDTPPLKNLSLILLSWSMGCI